ncbi:MAG: dTDP-4-dehydrorhamnose reductase [Lysobacterales bacterium]|jgi:dTDP-4-dehydrorhamnose reductase
MNILLTGSSGQLGQELMPRLRKLGSVTRVDHAASPDDRETVRQDLADLHKLEALLNRVRPDMIVNAAAYTAVDRAESEREQAFVVNADLPGCLGGWAQRNGAWLVHFSTDYVFAGDADRPYRESDPTGPLNVYGESKLAGEWAVTSSGCDHFVLRTSWVYSGHGNNFVLTMLRLAKERSKLSVVSDQIGRPTWARNLADAAASLAFRLTGDSGAEVKSGLYHYADADAVSWFDFARSIFSVGVDFGLLERMPSLTAVRTAEFPQTAKRPLYSVLDASLITDTFGVRPRGLQESLRACLEDMRINEQ